MNRTVWECAKLLPMKAVVAGATGLVGNELVRLLLEDSSFTEVSVYVRRPYPLEHPKLRVIQGDLGQLGQHREELKGEVYFSCLGTTIRTAGTKENFRKVDFHGVVGLGRLAFANRAKKFIVVSSRGADARSRIFYSRVKGDTEKTLKDLGLSSLVILRPGLLMGEREENRPAEKISIKAMSLFRHVLPEKLTRATATDVSALARRMVEEAKSIENGTKVIEAVDI